MMTNTNSAIVTWTIRGVKHDKVKYLTNGSEQVVSVVCYETCCCKTTALGMLATSAATST